MDSTKPGAPASRGTDAFVTLLLLGMFAAGAYLVVYAAREFAADRRMEAASARTEATVLDRRTVTSRRRGESLEVRYRFEVAGRAYGHGDSTGRDDLWVSLTPEAFARAGETGTVAVLYAPGDPSVNRPVDYAGSPLSEQIIGGITGGLCMLPTLLWMRGALRRRRAALTAP